MNLTDFALNLTPPNTPISVLYSSSEIVTKYCNDLKGYFLYMFLFLAICALTRLLLNNREGKTPEFFYGIATGGLEIGALFFAGMYLLTVFK